MMNSIQLRDEMGSWIWNLPAYFNIWENKKYESKLTNIMLQGLKIFNDSSFYEITFSDDEEYLHQSFVDMMRYVKKIDITDNIEFVYELIYEYYNFINKKFELTNKLITEKQYEIYKDNYSNILEQQEIYFNENVYINDFENTSFFRGYNEDFVREMNDVEKQESINVENMDDLFPNVE